MFACGQRGWKTSSSLPSSIRRWRTRKARDWDGHLQHWGLTATWPMAVYLANWCGSMNRILTDSGCLGRRNKGVGFTLLSQR